LYFFIALRIKARRNEQLSMKNHCSVTTRDGFAGEMLIIRLLYHHPVQASCNPVVLIVIYRAGSRVNRNDGYAQPVFYISDFLQFARIELRRFQVVTLKSQQGFAQLFLQIGNGLDGVSRHFGCQTAEHNKITFFH
jgi:hypothetical protein